MILSGIFSCLAAGNPDKGLRSLLNTDGAVDVLAPNVFYHPIK